MTKEELESLDRLKLIEILEALLVKFGDDASEIISLHTKGTEQIKAQGQSHQLVKSKGSSSSITQFKTEKKEKNKKDFDMTRYRQRHVAIQIQYEGEPFYGFTSQTGGCEETVEKHIFEALIKLRLITDKHTCQYSRCGRTDRGVSALGQTIALRVRSTIPMDVSAENMPKHPNDSIFIKKRKSTKKDSKGENKKKENGGKNNLSGNNSFKNSECSAEVVAVGLKRKECSPSKENKINESEYPPGDCNIEKPEELKVNDEEEYELEEVKEMDYCSMLNRVLPDSIRALGWCEVTSDFSSRFSCAYRKYRYFFVKRDLDIDAMSAAAALLVGEHDFRNICKIDIAKVTNFRREVYAAGIIPFQINVNNPELSVYMLEIRGIAFLWHMVRCIMSLLFMVGEGHEEPDCVTALLNIEDTPAKPHYKMAPELSLVLHECGFDNMRILHQPAVLWTLSSHFESLWGKHTIAAARAKNALDNIRQLDVRNSDVEGFISYLTGKKKAVCDRKSGWKGDKKGTRDTSASVLDVLNTAAMSDKAVDSVAALNAAVRNESDEHMNVTEELDGEGEGEGEVGITTESERAASAGGAVQDGSTLSAKCKDTSDVRPTTVTYALATSETQQWSDVLGILKEHSLTPTDALLPHVPLFKRHTNDTYMDRRNQLKGNKKERLDRHLQLKENNAETDPDFFQKMRGQGAV